MEKTFFNDLLLLQKEIKNPPKTESGYDNRYQYAPLDMMLDLYKPICLSYNFILLATIQNGFQVVELRHISGETLKGELLIPDYGTDAQKLGSFLTYARRYLIMNILNVMGEPDTDGAETTKNNQKSSQNVSTSEGTSLYGTIYQNRQGTSKTGKPYNAFFPQDKTKPVFWDKQSFDDAVMSESLGE